MRTLALALTLVLSLSVSVPARAAVDETNANRLNALGLFLLGVLYITPIRVKKPQLRGVALLSIFGLGEFAVLLRVLTR